MKKIFLFLTVAAMTLVGCKKNQDRVYPETAAAGIAGTYTGTWTATDDKGTVTEAEGTVVFSEVENEPYVALMTIKSDGLSLTGSCRTNVAHSGDYYIYYNNSATGLLPADASEDTAVPKFEGKVQVDGTTSFSFQLKTGKGKKAKNNTYSFSGAR